MSLPQLGKTHPAILATDDEATIRAKVDRQLSALREAFDEHITKEKADGGGNNPAFSPNARLSIPCAYVDEASASRIHDNAIVGFKYALSRLEDYGFFLLDVIDWRSVDFTDERDEPPFPHHEIGVNYALKIADKIGQEYHRQHEAGRFIEAKRRFDHGELDSAGPTGSEGRHLADLLRQLGQ